MFKNFHRILVILALLILAAGCAPGAEPTPDGPRTLTIITHDSFDVSESVVEAFQNEHNARLQFISGGDTGSTLNRLILSSDNPPADVFYGLDNTFLSRALAEGIFIPYDSPALEGIPAEFKLDPQNRALPVDYGDVCLNYDQAYFAERGLNPPQNLEDLLKPEYRGLLVVQNPATSSPGLAFLFATIAHFGEPGYLDYWQGLAGNDVLVVNNWESAYYSEFSRWGGTRPLVVSYGSSPPFEVIYAETPVDEPPTGVVTADGSCYRQIEFVGILRGTENEDLAQQWVDFMLSPAFQEDLPLKMFVFPVNPQAELDEVFVEFLAQPEHPGRLDPALVSERREAWIQAWTETVLR